MGTFDSFSDTANQLRAESGQITLTFDPAVPSSSQGTVVWNIPTPAIGCSIDNLQYSGMLIVLSTSPITPDNFPVNGTVYTADATANFDLHSGDKLGNALVVGAFYETNKKSTNQPFTISTIISDISSNTPYYVCGFPIDSQFRYYQEGIRAYSDSKVTKADPSLPATQTVEFASPIVATTGTNLVPEFLYQFDFVLDTQYDYQFAKSREVRLSPTAQIIPVTVNGTDCGTYEQLITEIYKNINRAGNPLISPVAPNSGQLYWNNSEHNLYEFNGTSNTLINNVFYEINNPASIVNGTVWFNTLDRVLKVYNSGWVVTPYTNSDIDPTSVTCDNYWFTGNETYKWNGTTWCLLNTLIQELDPSCPVINCGAFWFDETTSTFNVWADATQQWIPTSAIMWDVAPNALANGTKWFDLTNKLLFSWNGLVWLPETQLIISEDQPPTPAINSFWFKLSSEDLKQWNGLTYVDVNCLVWNTDPTLVESCKVWWKTTDDTLYVWDLVNNQWKQAIFTISEYDPHLAPIIDDGVVWFKQSTGVLSIWDGSVWVVVNDAVYSWNGTFVSSLDPTLPLLNTFWYSDATKILSQWNGSSWVAVDAIDSENDPTVIPTGTYWFNPSNNVLSVRNGLSWLAASYVVNSLIPNKGTRWYDSTNNALKEWNGTSWINALPLISIDIKDGKLIFTSKDVGANVYLSIDQKNNNTLFPALQPKATIWTPTLGGDGKSNVPSYLETGVGTDGSPDERRNIIDNVRRRLGYPTVQVELDLHTLSLCVDRALEVLRQQSGIGYSYRFFFVDVAPRQQVFKLTNKQLDFHKIVDILKINRFTSAFLTSAHGSGAYGQVVIQQLYSMSSFDFTSYYLISQYIEQMEILFATRLNYNWNEASRNLTIFNSFYTNETLLMECTVEKTEQELMTHRLTKPWIEKWALAEAMFNLAEIRGKFSTLPGASGGVSLNAGDLSSKAQALKDECLKEIEDYVVNNPEEFGSDTQFVLG